MRRRCLHLMILPTKRGDILCLCKGKREIHGEPPLMGFFFSCDAHYSRQDGVGFQSCLPFFLLISFYIKNERLESVKREDINRKGKRKHTPSLFPSVVTPILTHSHRIKSQFCSWPLPIGKQRLQGWRECSATLSDFGYRYWVRKGPTFPC